MKFENKIVVTSENKRQLEGIIGETLNIGDVMYLNDIDYELGKEKKPDLLSYLYQELPNTVLIWDNEFGLNLRGNLYAIDDKLLSSVEADLDNILVGSYGGNN